VYNIVNAKELESIQHVDDDLEFLLVGQDIMRIKFVKKGTAIFIIHDSVGCMIGLNEILV
jgi:hypothetical protein